MAGIRIECEVTANEPNHYRVNLRKRELRGNCHNQFPHKENPTSGNGVSVFKKAEKWIHYFAAIVYPMKIMNFI